MQRRFTIVITSILAALGAACGSSKKASSTAASTSQTQTRTATSIPSATTATALEPAFIARANAICARAKRSLDAHGQFPYQSFDPLKPDVKLLPKVGAFFAGTQSIADRVPVELRDLGTPRKAAVQWTRLVALAKQSRAIADRQIAAAKGSDAPAFVATVNEVSATQKQLERLGLESGFEASSPCTPIL